MSNMGANCAILDDEKRILLVKREDFEVWCLPGGMTDPGESLAQTAIREAKEETGLDVTLERLVGVYTRVGGYGDLHGALFTSTISGGEIQPQIEEVIDINWFALDALPDNIFWWHVPQIEDAIQGESGVAGCATLREAEPIQSRQELYAKRDESGMNRTAFYRYYFEKNGKDYQREL
jgi:8-oxo-dGTP pyrophosphatase MutT (NUDIX family)